MTGRNAVISRVSGRRRRTLEQKPGMLRDAFGSGGCVRASIEQHEVSSGQLHTWHRQAVSGELTGVAPPMLLRHPTIDRLDAMGLAGIARAFAEHAVNAAA